MIVINGRRVIGDVGGFVAAAVERVREHDGDPSEARMSPARRWAREERRRRGLPEPIEPVQQPRATLTLVDFETESEKEW